MVFNLVVQFFYSSQNSNFAKKITVLKSEPFQSGSVQLSDQIKNYDLIIINCGGTPYYIYNKDHTNTRSNLYVTGFACDWANPSNIGFIVFVKQCSINGATFTINDHMRQFNYFSNTQWSTDKNVYGNINGIFGINF